MIIDKFTHRFEIHFWDIVTRVAQEEGPLMKLVKKSKQLNRSRMGTLLLLVLIWAAVGFTLGLIFGKLILLFQYV
jgi:hypothetical protein